MLAALSVLLTSAVIFFRNIDAYPLRNWDEAWYAEIIKNMASGNYSLLVPFFNGQYYFDKPPLYFWLSLPFFKIFGADEWQARIVSALTAIGASLFIFLIGKKLFNTTVGIFAFFIFISLGQLTIRFAHGNLDALLVFLFLASFYFYLLSSNGKIFAIFCGVSIGLGFLVKGWFLGLYPPLIITLYALFIEKKLPRNLILIISSTLFSSSWYFILGASQFGKPFIDWYLLTPTIGLLGSPLASFSLSYFQDLVRDIGFWWIPVVFFLFMFRTIPKLGKNLLLMLLTSILILIFPLNFLSEKLGWYNLPTYPQVALIIAYTLGKLNQKSTKFTLILVATVLIAQVYNVARIENIYPDRSKVGADLGKFARQVIPSNAPIVLDDHDFTAFLFYSDHGKVYEVSHKGGKVGEWWTLKYDDLSQFISNNPNTWIITPDPNRLPVEFQSSKTKLIYNNYYFYSERKNSVFQNGDEANFERRKENNGL